MFVLANCYVADPSLATSLECGAVSKSFGGDQTIFEDMGLQALDDVPIETGDDG